MVMLSFCVDFAVPPTVRNRGFREVQFGEESLSTMPNEVGKLQKRSNGNEERQSS